MRFCGRVGESMPKHNAQYMGRRTVLKTAVGVGIISGGLGGVAAANSGGGVTKQTRNVMGPSLILAEDPDDLTDCEPYDDDNPEARPVYKEDGATLRRNPNSISAKIAIDTPEPGTYCYVEGETAVAEAGPPEAFTLWLFTFDEEQGGFDQDPDDPDVEPFPWSGAFFVAGHVVGGPTLNLSGQISRQTEPFVGFPLEDPDVEVHLAVAPHGALAPDIMPDQIKTPAGTSGHWWVSIFDEV